MKCNAIPYEGELPYVFFSFCHENHEIVYPLIERMAAAGFRVWFDDGIHPGQEWPEVIAEHLNQSAVCVCAASMEFQNSHNCKNELTFAVNGKKSLMAILLEDFEMSLGLKLQLGNTQQLKLSEHTTEEFLELFLDAPILQPCKGEPQLIEAHHFPKSMNIIREHKKEEERVSLLSSLQEKFTKQVRSERPQEGPAPQTAPQNPQGGLPIPPAPQQNPAPQDSPMTAPVQTPTNPVFPPFGGFGVVPPKEDAAPAPTQPEAAAPTAPVQPEAATPAVPPVMPFGQPAAAPAPVQPEPIPSIPDLDALYAQEPVAMEAAKPCEISGEAAFTAQDGTLMFSNSQPEAEQSPEAAPEAEIPEVPMIPVIPAAAKAPEMAAADVRPAPIPMVFAPETAAYVPSAKAEPTDEDELDDNATIAQPYGGDEDDDATVYAPVNPSDLNNDDDDDDRTQMDTSHILPLLIHLHTGKTYDCCYPMTSVGRSEKKCDVVLEEFGTISGHHIDIVIYEQKNYIIVKKSTNGTVINGVTRQTDDRIEVGNCAEVQLASEHFLVVFDEAAKAVRERRMIASITSRETKEQKFLLDEPMMLGRSYQWETEALTQKNIGRNHAEIEWSDGAFRITDMNSMNGTFINEQKLEAKVPYALRDGDKIWLATHQFTWKEWKLGEQTDDSEQA